MPGILIVSDGIFVFCDEIIVSQQCAAELLEPRAWQLDDLIHGTGFPLVLGLFPPEFCLNNHIIPPISIPGGWDYREPLESSCFIHSFFQIQNRISVFGHQ